jgi:predicted nucleic acid-binding protein
VPRTLADAGPLIALFDRDDKYHPRVLEFLKTFDGVILTTWPVVTEVCHLLDFSVDAQLAFLTWINRGGLIIEDLGMSALDEILALTQKHRDLPMDLADASLVVLAARKGIEHILSLDSDFYIYRLPDKEGSFNNLLDQG